jgi:hypothetical protein
MQTRIPSTPPIPQPQAQPQPQQSESLIGKVKGLFGFSGGRKTMKKMHKKLKHYKRSKSRSKKMHSKRSKSRSKSKK